MLRSPQKFNSIEGFYVMEQKLPHGFNKKIYSVLEVDNFSLVEFPTYAVDVEQLHFSTEKSGTYNIIIRGLNGSNAEPPEPIIVTHSSDYISWQVGKPVLERTYYFDKSQYSNLTHIMKKDLMSLIGHYHEDLWNCNIPIDNDDYRKWEFLKPLIDIYKLW